jgi:hypothetical protein
MVSERSAREQLAELDEDFAAAADAAGGVVERRFLLAGAPVSVRFAGEAAARVLGAAFAHLEAEEPEAPVFVLQVWDAARSAAARPALAPKAAHGTEPSATGPGPSYFYEGRGFRAMHQPSPDHLSVLSDDARTGWFWMPDVATLPHWDHAAPFRHLLSWWLAARGHQHVHGGAVGTEDAGVLLVGRGGSGKSTATLTSLLDGRLRYLGDDYVALGGEAERATVYSLYSSGKVHRPNLARVSHLATALANPDRLDEKAVVFVHEAFPGRAIGSLPLRAIVVPRIAAGERTRLKETTHAAALAALAPSTIFQLHPPAKTALARMAELVRGVPAFELELGEDVAVIPERLVELLARLG